MSAKILEFVNKDNSKPHHRKSDVIILSDEMVISRIIDDITFKWEKHSKEGTLNNFIHEKLPTKAKIDHYADYLNDISIVKKIEEILEMQISIMNVIDNYGNILWKCKFILNGKEYKINTSLKNECACRILNALVFADFSRYIFATADK